jgi:glycerol-3-phosphate dehydrogenase
MHKSYDIVIIGGGITGIGIARKAAAQGFSVILFEKNEIGSGTSGHFHELLHSGARYAVNDPVAAKECYEENVALCSSRSIVKDAITQIGGLFLAITESDLEYSEEIVMACQKIGIPIVEKDIEEVIRKEPRVTRKIKRALHVPDGYINGEKVLRINSDIAREYDAELLIHHTVIGFQKTKNRINAVNVRDDHNEEQTISCNFVINAAGVWSDRIAQLANITVSLVAYRGALLVFNEKICSQVLNRCRKPFNGDIFVPAGKHTIFGTTAKKTDNIDTFTIEPEEIQVLFYEGEQLIPDISKLSILKKFVGVRPLYSSTADTIDGRNISRSFSVINHKETDGIENFISVVGGKFTVYERMGDKALEIMKQNISN